MMASTLPTTEHHVNGLPVMLWLAALAVCLVWYGLSKGRD